MLRKIASFVLASVAVIYLINPTAGIFELLPDNLPLVGNLDEALATTILIAALRELGIDLTRWFRPKHEKPSRDVTPR